MMMFKTWGYFTMDQALSFTGELKLGHYMKIPPRPMFFCQVVATVVAGTVQLGVQSWMLSNIEDIRSPSQKDGFICPGITVFGTALVIVNRCSCWYSVSFTNVITLVGCHWTATPLLTWTTLLRTCLLPARCHRPAHPVGSVQEV
jgi:hypothetical protein